ncbi:hypothetical protein BJF80_08035 [Serinicoccus sp. CUA-874]|uniref:SCO1664 family protein n=1 Tax=Serinicoccus sp. CUA-874 TaxID=1517939 RepID=UPI000967E76B|nr:SCO1664 family protein [Serinicoccus sp. CUA-874]OLT15912.1 hypothetical protein BJF80_08035 [Serinicoccus sp. CUA-874]
MREDEALALLRDCALEPVGRLTQASNLTLLVELAQDGAATGHRAVYKPARGERPLHDFPPASLAAREVAAYAVSRAGGFDLVPPTVLRDGPLGEGSVQWWVEQQPERLVDPSAGLVDVLAPEDLEPGWRAVVQAEDEHGSPVVVAHADDPRLRTMATLDVVLNNADRKAAHLTIDVEGRLRGFDHGLALHEDDKLRTVLWGFAGEALPEEDRRRVAAVVDVLAEAGETADLLATLLSPAELTALRHRTEALLEAGILPMPSADRYPLPWPLW